MNVAGVLYLKCVPGLCGTGCSRNAFTPILSGAVADSSWWPADMRSRSRTRIAFRLSTGSAGASSGKKSSTGSSRLSLPSAIARPTAVEVKLLLSEYSSWLVVLSYGDHQPSATTWPWRTSMKLWRPSIGSSDSRKASTPGDETPCASGALRGSGGGACAAVPKAAHRNAATRAERRRRRRFTEGRTQYPPGGNPSRNEHQARGARCNSKSATTGRWSLAMRDRRRRQRRACSSLSGPR
jgi:hypothetical protein